MDNSILKDAGLTDGEAKVYISLLELGSSSTGPIMEKSRIARSIIYHILEKLNAKVKEALDRGEKVFITVKIADDVEDLRTSTV